MAMILCFKHDKARANGYQNPPVEFDYDDFVDFIEELSSGRTESQRIGALTDLSLVVDHNVSVCICTISRTRKFSLRRWSKSPNTRTHLPTT